MMKIYYRKAYVAIVCYDITNASSWDRLFEKLTLLPKVVSLPWYRPRLALLSGGDGG